jgi:phospholipase/lecithinase/hemolysin
LHACAAEAFGLPFVPPSLDTTQSFSKGANFAVVGATALDLSYFLEHNITSVPPFNSSFSVQIGWFEQLKPSLCSTPKRCDEYLGRSLFVIGEFGGNDYVFLLAANKTVEETRAYVPAVVKDIADGVEVGTRLDLSVTEFISLTTNSIILCLG